MSQPFGRESETLAPNQSSQIPFLIVATLSVGFLLRALWIATADLPEAKSAKAQAPTVADSIVAAATIAESATVDPSATQTTMSASEYAMLMSVCPTGAAELPSDLKPQPDLRVASRPGAWPADGRIRVANKSNNSKLGDWLVEPETWYGPEGAPDSETTKRIPDAITEPGSGEAKENEPAEEEIKPKSVTTAKPEIPEPSKPARIEAESMPFEPKSVEPSVTEPPVFSPPVRIQQPSLPETDEPLIAPMKPIVDKAIPEQEPPLLRPQNIESVPLGPNFIAPVETPVEQLPKAKPELSLPAESKPIKPNPPEPKKELFTAPSVTEPAVVSEEALPLPNKPVQIEKPEPIVQPTQVPNLNPHGNSEALAAEARKAADGKSAYEAHRDLYLKNCYPSARDCAECHKQIYEEWSTSSHAYAYVSPMFHKFEQTISMLSQGTVGHFCTRCHSPVTATMGLPRSVPMQQLSGAQVEGVTCIVCHRVNERYGKTNGDRRIVPGSLEDPIYGGIGGEGVRQAIAERDKYKVKTSADDKSPGQLIHNEGRFFDQLSKSEACTSCHQVAVHPGIKLEVVWEQYRNSPACKKGVSCQDCHMGRIPGVPSGYNYGPIAEVGGKTVNNHRKQANHSFFGPGYSIAHPGIFPQHKDAGRWTMDEWLTFDWRAGWGTDEFEERVEQAEDQGIDTSRWFPPAWQDIDDRCDARDIISDNQKKLARKQHLRELVMENGSKVDGPFFRESPRVGEKLEFDFIVANLNEGHNLPTASLGAQPQLWANVVLIGPRGQRLWETGYLDKKGDLCDIHSEEVRHGQARFDEQLFNLQTIFLYTGAVGTDREWTLPVNISFDQVPHLRPGAVPISVLNHPPFIRMESRSIAPLGKKRVKYSVPADLMCEPGRYRLSFRLRSRLEPIYFMRFCDATNEMIRSMTEQTLDIHPYSVEFEVR